MKQAIFFLLLTLLWAVGSPAETETPSPDTDLAEKIRRFETSLLPRGAFPPWKKANLEDRMAFYKVPGVSIAIMDDFKVVFARGYGVTEPGGDTPVDTGTVFQALGNTSAVTRFLTLHLISSGKIGQYDPVNDRLVSWKIPENEFTRQNPVLVRYLMFFNTAGLNDFNTPLLGENEPLPTLLQVLEGEAPAVNPPIRVISRPGTFRRGAGNNHFLVSFIVLQQLIEDVSGKPFEQFAEEVVFDPLGLEDTSFRNPLPGSMRDRITPGYKRDEEGNLIKEKSGIFHPPGARGLWSTPTDLARFALEVCAVHKGKEHHGIVSHEAFKEFTGPLWNRYYINSNGGGYLSTMTFNPHNGQGVVIMANTNYAYHLRTEILHSVATSFDWGWGHHTMQKTILGGMLILVGIIVTIAVFLLIIVLLMVGRRKKIKNKQNLLK